MQDLHNVHYQGTRYKLKARNRVEPEFKSEAQSAYGNWRRVDCQHEPVDHDCWLSLHDEIVAGAGADIGNN